MVINLLTIIISICMPKAALAEFKEEYNYTKIFVNNH